jgi:hypothetical protein
LWRIESRVAVGLEVLVEVLFESLFERHVCSILVFGKASKIEETEEIEGSIK